jgi:SRSO17 transposase
LAERMLARAWRLGVEAAWVTGGAVYGNDTHFRRFLEANRQPYASAVRSDMLLWDGHARTRVDRIADAMPAKAWRKASAGAGSKGPRWCDWAVKPFGPVDERGWQPRLLVRRHREKREERAYHLCRGPAATPRRELVRAAGSRWPVEECFERGKGDCGLDEYEVRNRVGWYRHVTLSIFALALPAAIRDRAGGEKPPKKGGPG